MMHFEIVKIKKLQKKLARIESKYEKKKDLEKFIKI